MKKFFQYDVVEYAPTIQRIMEIYFRDSASALFVCPYTYVRKYSKSLFGFATKMTTERWMYLSTVKTPLLAKLICKRYSLLWSMPSTKIDIAWLTGQSITEHVCVTDEHLVNKYRKTPNFHCECYIGLLGIRVI